MTGVAGAALLGQAFWPASPGDASKAITPFAEAEPVFRALGTPLPFAFAGEPGPVADARWATWVAARDAEIRARGARHEPDAILSLGFSGTSFAAARTAASSRSTGAPPAAATAFPPLLSAYVVERALNDLVMHRLVDRQSIRRVAVVGPGLEFRDDGHARDFYPEQTLQPFTLADSLVRVGLAHPDRLELTIYDVDPRVLDHVAAVQAVVQRGASYRLHLPLPPDTPSHAWQPGLVAYWQRAGNWIGADVAPGRPPDGMDGLRARAVRVTPAIVQSLRAADLNVVLERPSSGASDASFNLVVATNAFASFAPIEQALALANIHSMLRPGGLLLAAALAPGVPIDHWSPAFAVHVVFDHQQSGDTVCWLTAQPARHAIDQSEHEGVRSDDNGARDFPPRGSSLHDRTTIRGG
ncbi:MAG: class I SAM-dependent methyltransferase [Acidobacteria bacterium]|nr:class I SAM-dependent methyltransferase [Acidobacteriota bacterium]